MSLPQTTSNTEEIVSPNDIPRLCRICLTQNFPMISMDCSLCKDSPHEPSILEAIEKVMSIKLIINEKYPSQICTVCKSLLKVAYNLYIVFNNSQSALAEYFQDVVLTMESTPVPEEAVYTPSTSVPDQNSTENIAPVELICGNNIYNLNDIMIVDNEEEEKQNFQGFLNNLGKSVSAVFVDKPNTSQNCDNSTENNTSNNSMLGLEPSNTEFENGPIMEFPLDEYLFDNQLFASINENEISAVETENLQPANNIVEQNSDKENITLRKIYKCDACNILCANKTRLKLHLKRKHSDLTPYLCERCVSVSFYKDGDSKPESDLISCEDCGLADTKRKITSKITVSKMANKEYICQICGHISTNSANARYHKTKHLETQHQCNICDKSYRTRALLKRHINLHKNVKDLLCTVCGKKFRTNNSLMYHMRIHTDDRKYVCEICDKRFYIQCNWKRHMRRHTGEKPYNCNYCEKKFFSTGERKTHERIHTGERPYECLYCDRAFISNVNRQYHYMAHSGPHTCDYCTRTFIELEFLRKHIKSRHSVENKV